MPGILSMILAGGEGSSLAPLTNSRTKPALPFAGNYRLIDFALNNFVNSGLLKIYVLTQFKSQSLNIHLRQAWHLSGITDHFIDALPAQMRFGKRWYDGTADAVYQNSSFIEQEDPDHVCIFGSDHIYKMDIRQMVNQHQQRGATLTVAAIRVPVSEAHHFGIIEVDAEGRMIGFEEKPKSSPKTIPGDKEHVLASMGNYVFETKTLLRMLDDDSKNVNSTHDFGKDIIPKLYPHRPVYVYDFSKNEILQNEDRDQNYWRDVGTIESYWATHMDLLREDSPFSLYNRNWPLHTYYPSLPPAQFKETTEQAANISNSLISAGSIIHSSQISQSVLGYSTQVAENCSINESVLIGGAKIGEGCQISRAIIDKDVEIAPGTIIGQDIEADRERFTVSDEGIVVIGKGSKVGF